MADLPQLLEHIASGLLSGGLASITTVFGIYRDFRTRIKALEDAVGAAASATHGTATGFYRIIENFEERVTKIDDAVHKLQKDIEEWEDQPPDWVVRLVTRTRSSSSVNLEVQQEYEARVESRLRTFQDRLMRELEDTKKELDALKKEFRDHNEQYLLRDVYLQESRRKAEELSTVKENLAAANGLLRGVLGSLGLIGSDNERR